MQVLNYLFIFQESEKSLKMTPPGGTSSIKGLQLVLIMMELFKTCKGQEVG